MRAFMNAGLLKHGGLSRPLLERSPGHGDIFFFNVKTDKSANPAAQSSQCGMANAKEWIEHDEFGPNAMDFYAIHGELHGERVVSQFENHPSTTHPLGFFYLL